MADDEDDDTTCLARVNEQLCIHYSPRMLLKMLMSSSMGRMARIFFTHPYS